MSDLDTNTQSTQQAERYNSGKPKLTMVPKELIEEVAKVLEFGAKKYARDNWRKGMPWTETMDSCMRHLLKWKEGEELDEESGLSHLSHAACNLAFLLTYTAQDLGKDDRYKGTELDKGIKRDIEND